MTTTPQQIAALFAVLRVGNDLVQVTRRLLIGIDAQDAEMVADVVTELRALVLAHGHARAEMVSAVESAGEVRS